jgi:hypothetical protein
MATISDSTLQQYITNLTTIAREVGADSNEPKWVEKHWANIKKYLESIENLHTRKSKVCAVLFTDNLSPLPTFIQEYLKRQVQLLFDAINERYARNTKDEKQTANWVDLTDVEERIDELELQITTELTYENYKNILRYLMLLFHRHIPLRNDLANTKIVYNASDDVVMEPNLNYIFLDKKTLVMNTYKTFKTYGTKTIPILPVVIDAIEMYLPILQHFSPHGFFYAKMDGQKHTNIQFSKLFNSIWKVDGKNVGSTQLRRTIVSELYNVVPDEYKKKQELAAMMGHSPQIASLVYAKAGHRP